MKPTIAPIIPRHIKRTHFIRLNILSFWDWSKSILADISAILELSSLTSSERWFRRSSNALTLSSSDMSNDDEDEYRYKIFRMGALFTSFYISAIDVITTDTALRLGFREDNPILNLLLAKLGPIALLAWWVIEGLGGFIAMLLLRKLRIALGRKAPIEWIIPWVMAFPIAVNIWNISRVVRLWIR